MALKILGIEWVGRESIVVVFTNGTSAVFTVAELSALVRFRDTPDIGPQPVLN